MRILFALFALGHAFAHLPGFVVNWQLRAMPELPYRTTVFAGAVDLGAGGARLLGAGWLLAAAAFLLVALGAVLDAGWVRGLADLAIAGSLLLCLAAWPDARYGVVADVVLAALLLVLRA